MNVAGVDHDLIADAFAAQTDPWPVWRMLRDAGPVVESGPMFLVTRMREARLAFRNDTGFSSDSRRRGTRAQYLRARLNAVQLAAFDEIAEFHANWVQVNDGDAHRRLRGIALRAFTPDRIASLEVATGRYVGEHIDRMAQESASDLKEFAFEVPLQIMTDLLGVPASDRALIRKWSADWFEFQFVDDDRILISLDAQRSFLAYVRAMIEENRQRADTTDLVSAMVGAEYDDRLSADELAGMFFMLLFAGHETTSNLLGTGMLELLRDRAQWERMVSRPDIIPQAVEELLRFVSPVQYLHRYSVADVELGGINVPGGSTVTVVLAAANRDADVFQSPDALDIERAEAGKQLAFGFGPHFCLGNILARMEARVGFTALVTRLPQIELACDPADLTWRGGSQLRGLESLPVTAGPLKS